MVLIIGGACQGKLDFAREKFHLRESDIYRCTGPEIDFSRRCICHLEKFSRDALSAGLLPEEYLRKHQTLWQDTVFICQDIFCGVVPTEPELRRWRDETGKLCQLLARDATQVYRIFCGLELKLK